MNILLKIKSFFRSIFISDSSLLKESEKLLNFVLDFCNLKNTLTVISSDKVEYILNKRFIKMTCIDDNDIYYELLVPDKMVLLLLERLEIDRKIKISKDKMYIKKK